MEHPKLPYKSIKEAWAYFSAQVISPRAPAIQREEMKKAFMAGASSCFDVMTWSGPENETDEEGEKRIARIHQEFVEYAKTLVR